MLPMRCIQPPCMNMEVKRCAPAAGYMAGEFDGQKPGEIHGFLDAHAQLPRR